MTASAPTPERIRGMIKAYQGSQVLKGAQELAEAIETSRKGMRVLCDFLTIRGLLEKQGGTYRSSPDAALFLDRRSPAYFSSVGRVHRGAGDRRSSCRPSLART